MDQRSEVASRVGALAVFVDARDWERLQELLAAEVHVDYTSLFGGAPQVLPRERLVAAWRELLPGFTHTTHVIGTPSVTVDGATAQASASVVAWHFVATPELAGNDLWLAGGCYEMALSKAEGTWRIAGLKLARAWQHGNADLLRIAGERAKRSQRA